MKSMRMRFTSWKNASLALLCALMLFTTVGSANAASYSLPIGASCSRGAQVGVSGSGIVTVDFWYRTQSATTKHTQRINFGSGRSQTVFTNFAAAYDAVTVTGSGVQRASGAKCR